MAIRYIQRIEYFNAANSKCYKGAANNLVNRAPNQSGPSHSLPRPLWLRWMQRQTHAFSLTMHENVLQRDESSSRIC
jgi:hypothetical protein